MQSIRKLGTIPNQAAAMPEVNTIYIEADEDHVAMQKSKAKEMKLITVYESKVPVCRGRREVLGQRVCSGWEPPSQIWAEVNQYIQQVYGAKQAPNVMIKGDAARWITARMGYVEKSHQVVDGYHASQYIRKIAGKETSTPLYKALRTNNQDMFIKKVQQRIRRNPQRKKLIMKGYRYIIRNWDGIHEALTRPDAASSTEGHVRHILSDRLSSRCMGWSPMGAKQMARMRTYVANGGNLEAYALKQFALSPQAMKPEVNQDVLQKEYIR